MRVIPYRGYYAVVDDGGRVVATATQAERAESKLRLLESIRTAAVAALKSKDSKTGD